MRAAGAMHVRLFHDEGSAVRGVPWWGVLCSAAALVLPVAGWTVAAGLQPRPFDAVAGTVSALAAPGAADRWVMTLVFAVVGACEVMTGLALRPAAAPGRLVLMAGGAAGMLVAANPQHAGGSPAHALWAVAGFAALVTWPGGAWRRGVTVPWALRPAISFGAAAVLLGLLVWFGGELIAGGGRAGLAERVLGVAQAAWPLVVVLSCRHGRCGRRGTTPVGGPRRGVRVTRGPLGPDVGTVGSPASWPEAARSTAHKRATRCCTAVPALCAERSADVAEVVAGPHDEPEHIAVHIDDPVAGNLVGGHDQHRLGASGRGPLCLRASLPLS